MAVLLTPMHAAQPPLPSALSSSSSSSSDFASSQEHANSLALTAGRGCEVTALHSPKTREQGSAESLTSLLTQIPDIVIPEPVHNPLPLQCLAVTALPEAIREEIDRVLDEYSVMASSPRQLLSPNAASANSGSFSSSSSTFDDGSKEIGRHQVAGAESDQAGGHDTSMNGAAKKAGEELKPTLHSITIKRSKTLSDNVNDLGVGFRVTGGVKCISCKTLHTVITALYADSAHSGLLREGVSIKRWGNKDLDDCTFEEVKVFLKSFAESAPGEFPVILRECSSSDHIASELGACGSSRSLCLVDSMGVAASWRRSSAPTQCILSTDFTQVSHRTEDTDSSSGDPTSDRSRPSSLEILDFPDSAQNVPPASPSSWSPIPEESRNENVTVSIPRLDSNARALSAAIVAKQKSSKIFEEEGFSRFANGMIQLSLKYSSDLEDLQVTLHKVQGQSTKEIHDTNDVFINTYLLPDTRNQGVRSIRVSGAATEANQKTDGEESHSYMITKDDLEKCVLRVLLWDARKSKKSVFRGEVLLGLSDNSIVSLSGEPVWFTVCPRDPNTPSLPPPCHYNNNNKHHGHTSMENIFNKLKQKAWLFGTLSASTVKHSASLTNDLRALGLDVGRGGRRPGSADSSPRSLRKGKSAYGQEFLRTLKSEMEREGTASTGGGHTINEAKLAKLHSMLNVLRDETEDSGADSSSPDQQQEQEQETHSHLPKFLDIFESPTSGTIASDSTKTLPSNKVKKRHASANGTSGKKRKRRSKALMHVLKEDLAGNSSDSGDNVEEEISSELNEQSAAWLRSRKPGGRGPGSDSSRPRSDSFQTIPKLRESLNAGKRNTVFTYDFDEQRAGIRNRPRKARQSGLVHTSDSHSHGERDSVTSTGTADSARARAGGQIHYQMVVVEDDTPAHQDNSVPVEVSLHRINVTDVDKPFDEEEMAHRSKSFDVKRPPAHGDKVDTAGEGEGTGKHLLTMRDKARSRSTGDMESTDDEVLVVRTPVLTPSISPAVEHRRTHIIRTSLPVGSTAAPLIKKRPHSNEGEGFTSLDFSTVKAIAKEGSSNKRKDFFRSSRQSCDLLRTSWEYNDQVGMVTGKSKSLDNLLEAAEPVLRSRRHPSAGPERRESSPLNREGSKVVAGDAKLEVEYNDLNPQHPVLMVKLLDILFQSNKHLPSEFLMKCQVVHVSSGVCILKNKTVINMKKNTTSSAPLGLLQFQTDMFNLCLEISFFSFGMFSKKEIGQVYLDLNSLELTRDMPYCEWLPITKDISSVP